VAARGPRVRRARPLGAHGQRHRDAHVRDERARARRRRAPAHGRRARARELAAAVHGRLPVRRLWE
jgi:hypothetical protein